MVTNLLALSSGRRMITPLARMGVVSGRSFSSVVADHRPAAALSHAGATSLSTLGSLPCLTRPLNSAHCAGRHVEHGRQNERPARHLPKEVGQQIIASGRRPLSISLCSSSRRGVIIIGAGHELCPQFAAAIPGAA
jgi:hypothetical protein